MIMHTPKDLKSMVQSPQTVSFTRYQKGELWYITECGFEFPVPLDDTGDGAFLAKDKAMMFMRYIRKHLAHVEQGRQECADVAPSA